MRWFHCDQGRGDSWFSWEGSCSFHSARGAEGGSLQMSTVLCPRELMSWEARKHETGRNVKTRHSCSIYMHKHAAHLLNRWRSLAPRNSQPQPVKHQDDDDSNSKKISMQLKTALLWSSSRSPATSVGLHTHRQSVKARCSDVAALERYRSTCLNATLHKIPHA